MRQRGNKEKWWLTAFWPSTVHRMASDALARTARSMYVGSIYLTSEWTPISLKWDLICGMTCWSYLWFIDSTSIPVKAITPVFHVQNSIWRLQWTNLLLKVDTDVTKNHVPWCISCIWLLQIFLKIHHNITSCTVSFTTANIEWIIS